MMILEGNSLANALQVADTALKKGIMLVDVRVVRTAPKNVILTLTSNSVSDLVNLNSDSFARTVVDNTTKVFKGYFQIEG